MIPASAPARLIEQLELSCQETADYYPPKVYRLAAMRSLLQALFHSELRTIREWEVLLARTTVRPELQPLRELMTLIREVVGDDRLDPHQRQLARELSPVLAVLMDNRGVPLPRKKIAEVLPAEVSYREPHALAYRLEQLLNQDLITASEAPVGHTYRIAGAGLKALEEQKKEKAGAQAPANRFWEEDRKMWEPYLYGKPIATGPRPTPSTGGVILAYYDADPNGNFYERALAVAGHMARRGLRILLVDLIGLLNYCEGPGLNAFLQQREEFENCIDNTRAGFDVLRLEKNGWRALDDLKEQGAKLRDGDCPQLATTGRLGRFRQEIGAYYDIEILLCPPGQNDVASVVCMQLADALVLESHSFEKDSWAELAVGNFLMREQCSISQQPPVLGVGPARGFFKTPAWISSDWAEDWLGEQSIQLARTVATRRSPPPQPAGHPPSPPSPPSPRTRRDTTALNKLIPD